MPTSIYYTHPKLPEFTQVSKAFFVLFLQEHTHFLITFVNNAGSHSKKRIFHISQLNGFSALPNPNVFFRQTFCSKKFSTAPLMLGFSQLISVGLRSSVTNSGVKRVIFEICTFFFAQRYTVVITRAYFRSYGLGYGFCSCTILLLILKFHFNFRHESGECGQVDMRAFLCISE
jgi:hypothetical protein